MDTFLNIFLTLIPNLGHSKYRISVLAEGGSYISCIQETLPFRLCIYDADACDVYLL